jgi:hypothetical protein
MTTETVYLQRDDGSMMPVTHTVEESVQEEPIAEKVPYVIITWPGDPERDEELYGPFQCATGALEWTIKCQEAAARGHELLKDAYYVITGISAPFDPDELPL